MTISWPLRRAACIQRPMLLPCGAKASVTSAGSFSIASCVPVCDTAKPADHDRHARAARARPWPRIDVDRPPAVGGADRQRTGLALLDQRLVGQMRDAQILADRGRVADDDDAVALAGSLPD